MGSTRLNPTHVGWVGLGWTYVMGWIGLNFFWLTMVGWVKKFSQPDQTRPMHTSSSSPNIDHSKIKKGNSAALSFKFHVEFLLLWCLTFFLKFFYLF